MIIKSPDIAKIGLRVRKGPVKYIREIKRNLKIRWKTAHWQRVRGMISKR